MFSCQGEEVEEFQPLCEVQSDKATIEITSRYKGKILQILFAPGDVVKVEWHRISCLREVSLLYWIPYLEQFKSFSFIKSLVFF